MNGVVSFGKWKQIQLFTTNGTHALLFNSRPQSIHLRLSYNNCRSAVQELSRLQMKL